MTSVDTSTALIAIVGGIAFSMLLYERTNLSAGSVIAPGIAAVLIVMRPASALALAAAAVLTGVMVSRLSERLYVFGKRRYAMLLLVGMVLMWALDAVMNAFGNVDAGYRVLGYLVPGLIGTDFQRQGITRTMVGFSVVTAAAVAVVIAIGLL